MMKSLLSSKWLQFLVAFTLLRDGFQLNSCVDSNPTITNPLDIGAVYNCTEPTNLSFCSISYPVPEAVANLARVWETLAENEYEMVLKNAGLVSGTPECLAEMRERLCAQYFPRCYLEEQVVNVEFSNEAECLPSCQSDIKQQLCSVFEFRTNSSLGACKPVSDYAKEYNYTFSVCGHDADRRYVTEWMFHHLRREDRELKKAATFLISEKCLEDYFNFKCEEIGRCWNQGERIELSKNMTECSRLNSQECFNSQQLELVVTDELACAGYPNVEPLATEPTMISTCAPTTTNASTPVVAASPTTSLALDDTVGMPSSSTAVHSQLPVLSLFLTLCTVIRRLLM